MSNMTDKERIGILEVKTEDHERRLRVQENNSKNLAEIATYVRLQVKHNEKQDLHNEKITAVMNDIHINLANLNKDIKEVKSDVGNVKSGLESVGGRVDEIESKRMKELEGYKDRSVGFYLSILSALIVGGLLVWLGFK